MHMKAALICSQATTHNHQSHFTFQYHVSVHLYLLCFHHCLWVSVIQARSVDEYS